MVSRRFYRIVGYSPRLMRVLLRVQANWKRGDEHGGRSSVPKERSQRRKGLPVDVIDQQHSKKKNADKSYLGLSFTWLESAHVFLPTMPTKIIFLDRYASLISP